MPDLTFNVDWQRIQHEAQSGNIPHSVAISISREYNKQIITGLSRILLGSYRPSHPDLMIIGTEDKPPQIGDPMKANYEGTCRWLNEQLSLRPLESRCRLGVIQSADKLNKSAGNSLLKLTEEPPAYVYLLYLMEDERLFLPTLRSRSQLTIIPLQPQINAQRIPLDDVEWMTWLQEARTTTNAVEAITLQLTSWRDYALGTGNGELAIMCEKLRRIGASKNLSASMMIDLIQIYIQEGDDEFENILDDIR